MAEDRFEPREINFRQWLPWTQLFRGFGVAVDYKKLLLAAAGIFVMAFGWWLLAWVFYSVRTVPDWGSGKYDPKDWNAFKEARNQWNLFYEAAGPDPVKYDANDLATSTADYDLLVRVIPSIENQRQEGKSPAEIREAIARDFPGVNLSELTPAIEGRYKPYGKLRTWPWFENRGPNPYLLVTGKVGHPDLAGTAHYVPWNRGEFFDWLLSDQIPVLIEPLVKFLRPVFYLLRPYGGFFERFYFLLVIAWTVVTWAIFGGAITRIATLEIARNEKIGLVEALRYTCGRWRSYVFASFAPLLALAFFVVLLILFGLVNWIPIVAEFWNGLLWPVVLGIGLVMTVLLIGLVGWPMIHATLSAEGSDSYDALSRCYSYVLQRPWSYLWYAVVSIAYGAAIIFFVGLVGSLLVYLGKWGVSQTPLTERFNRDPAYLFIYAPTSYGWRDMLLQGSPVADGNAAVSQRLIDRYVQQPDFHGWNYIGPALVAFWLYLVFLMMIGFGYSYFWSMSAIIYLLMRRKVDDTDIDEVYLEEEEEESYTAPVAPSSSPPTASSGTPLQMVEPPAMRSSAPAPAAPETDGSKSSGAGMGTSPST
jgi:hypothetical protein